MTPSKRLSKLSDRLCRRIDRLRSTFSSRPFSAALRDSDRVVAYCIIELANIWNQYTRCYYLSCVIGARQRSGTRVSYVGPLLSYNDALIKSCVLMGKTIRGAVPTPFEEPDWSAPGTLIKLAQDLQFSNQAEIIRAFAITQTIFQPLNICRNFYAHRSKVTADKIEDLSRRLAVLPAHRRATSLVCSAPRGSGHSLFERWCGLIQNIAMSLAS
jgi:hypothetical protein